MSYIPLTPFRRSADAVLLPARPEAGSEPLPHVNKWEILRHLAAARKVFGLSDRDLSVLRGLLTFHPETELHTGVLIVHPSNHSIAERLNGMPLSTMRRHISRLVETGFLRRNDSPNGKRYLRRSVIGNSAFGFDISPLVTRSAEIIQAAESVQRAEAALCLLRETVSLMRRDLAGLASWGKEMAPALMNWDQLSDLAQLTSRVLRRNADTESLTIAKEQLQYALNTIHQAFAQQDQTLESEEMSTSAARNEQHHQNSNKDSDESDSAETEITRKDARTEFAENKEELISPSTPLPVVLNLCQEVQNYSPDPIRSWHQFVQVANQLPPMMGISGDVWRKAKTALGIEEAAVVLSAILERFSEIRSPGAYLRHISNKALQGAFSSGPMLRALSARHG